MLMKSGSVTTFEHSAGLQNEAQKLSFCCEQADFLSDILVM